MKTLISVRFFSFLLILLSALTPAQSHSKGSKYKLITEIIDSTILSEQRTVSVQLPKNYHNAPDNRPVIYRFDGAEVPHNLVTSAGSFNAYFNLFYSAAMPIRFYKGNLNSIENYYTKVSEQRGKKCLRQKALSGN